jgi:predicted outer membrane repeat protein
VNEGDLSLEGTTLSGNSAPDDAGGGLFNDGTLKVSASKFTGNTAYWGGGILNRGSLEISASTFKENKATCDGGALQNEGVAIIASGSVVSGNSAETCSGGGLWNTDVGTLTVADSTISGNFAGDSGGGIASAGILTVEGSAVSSNTAGNEGGGLQNRDTGTALIQNASVLSSNSSSNGGGVFNRGSLNVADSALLGNTSPGEGDAIYSEVDNVNAASITGSCIVGNGDVAVFNSQPASQNAAGNWWGDPSGPSGAGPGGGDSVSENVDFSGWLTAPPAVCAAE